MLCLGLLVGNGWGQEAVDTDDESSHYFPSLLHFIHPLSFICYCDVFYRAKKSLREGNSVIKRPVPHKQLTPDLTQEMDIT